MAIRNTALRGTESGRAAFVRLKLLAMGESKQSTKDRLYGAAALPAFCLFVVTAAVAQKAAAAACALITDQSEMRHLRRVFDNGLRNVGTWNAVPKS